MLVVVGTQLDQTPRFWDKSSEWYLPQVKAMMVSYADFHKSSAKRKAAMEKGIHTYLGVESNVSVYLDNGAFAFWRKGMEPPIDEYVEFVTEARPDWYPIPTDYIPSPHLNGHDQKVLFNKTMQLNLEYASRGFVPVMHVGDWLSEYLTALDKHQLLRCAEIALGGLVPRLLSSKGSASRELAIDAIKEVRSSLGNRLHLFGIGGLGTLHLAACLIVDSIDSSGWRNRAARGLILLPGKGERTVVPLGNWCGKEVSQADIRFLERCECPACQRYGLEGLRTSNDRRNADGRGRGTSGFNRRAIHNLWTILKEAEEVESKLQSGKYEQWYRDHVRSRILLRLIEHALDNSKQTIGKEQPELAIDG